MPDRKIEQSLPNTSYWICLQLRAYFDTEDIIRSWQHKPIKIPSDISVLPLFRHVIARS